MIEKSEMNSLIKIVLVIMLFDAMGIGFIMLVLLMLLCEFIVLEDIVNYFGVLFVFYVLM